MQYRKIICLALEKRKNIENILSLLDYLFNCAKMHNISNTIEIPSHEVAPDCSNGGETSTKSIPIKFTPLSSRTTCNT